MSLGNTMWGIFRHTGDIGAYLAYKDCLQCGCGNQEELLAQDKVTQEDQ